METIHEGTRRSLIESGAGHLQVYHSASPQTPVLLTGPAGAPELVPIEDFPGTEALLLSVDGVQDVVPMEAGTASVFRGNYLDEKLAAVRAVTREPASEARDARLARLGEDLRRTLRRVAGDERQREQAFAGDVGLPEDRRTLEVVTSDAFWARFRADPDAALEYLEARVAKLAGEGESLPLDYLGTDPVSSSRGPSRASSSSRGRCRRPAAGASCSGTRPTSRTSSCPSPSGSTSCAASASMEAPSRTSG